MFAAPPPAVPIVADPAVRGGRDGATVPVTQLGDSGPGSLREAVARGGHTIVFDIGGTIRLRSELHISSDITLDGGSAPAPGITIYGQPVSFSGSHNDVVRFLRLRQGADSGKHKSSLEISKGAEMRFDHVSIEWGRWDCIDVNDSRNIVFQSCLIGEGIGPQRFGCLCGSDAVTFVGCLFVNNQSRNPKAKGKVTFINNVIYNWGVTGFVGGHSAAPHSADLVGNYFIAGPSTRGGHFVGEFAATDQIYQADNYVDLARSGMLNGRLATIADFAGATLTDHPVMALPEGILPAAAAFAVVVADAGDSQPRDAVDARLAAQVMSFGRDGQIVSTPPPADVPGAPTP